jgi:alkanesulfonate monooxygenase SsuD/methylene tetrahydromethanopterin reductase-like flavin-dependent oxidoreductase (luciferase family)
MMDAISVYRSNFRPSEHCERPHLMLGATVVPAGDDATAQRLFTSIIQTFVAFRRGRPIPVPPPRDDIESLLTLFDRAQLALILLHAIVGGPARETGSSMH